MKHACWALLLLMSANASNAAAATAGRSQFGHLPDGRAVESVTLENGHGVRVRILTYGAIIQSLAFPDRSGAKADVVLGFDDLAGYLAKPPYFGATVGRYANRIANGRFTFDGKVYNLAKNNGPNSLHGGDEGFDKKLWTVLNVRSGAEASVTLAYASGDGEEGYPGTLKVTATFALNERNELAIDYRATTDKATVVNITGHSYFNLAGEGSTTGIGGHKLTIPAESITPVGSTLIPTGELRPVAGTPFDFRHPAAIGERVRDGRDTQIVYGKGYDHNFVLGRTITTDLHLAARVEDPASGRVLEVLTNQPGVQFYSGNFLDGTIVGKAGHIYRQGDALCLEPQIFPDTPNQPAFGSARLDPGQTYHNRIVYRFSTSR